MNKPKSVHSGHRERLRQRIIHHDVDSLEPHELLEFLLFFAIPRQDVNTLSHTLIDHCGGLFQVLTADPEKLTQVKGLGSRAAQWLNTVGKCLYACGQLIEDSRLTIQKPIDLISFAQSIEEQYSSPCTIQICIDVHSRINYCRVICESLNWNDPKVLRSAIQDAIYTGAARVVILMFTGTDIPEAESDYIAWSQQYDRTLNTIDSRLLDVMMIGKKECLSLFIRSTSKGSDDDLNRTQKRWMHEGYMERFRSEAPDDRPDTNPYYK